MKTQIDKLDAVPSKRLYLSIIADYDTPLSVCELVDNALDVWSRNGKTGDLVVEIELNQTQQTIAVKDFAGGLPRKDIANVIAPGHTGTTTSEETIGIFGVGTKRAVVALAQQVRIRTRFKKEKTLEIEFNDEWLKEDSWELPLYETTDIEPGCTVVELSKLRQQIDEASIEHLRSWLGATYGNFLNDPAIKINLNGIPVVGQHFDNWSYPPRYEPRHYHGTLTTSEGRSVAVSATAGLSNESSPATGEYGVYVYCNDRLIARALKSFDVGFIKGMAGLPHPKVSLTKVILSLSGDARDMPWNSSKSDLSPKHKVFHALQNWLIKIVSDYAQLSRIWMGDWPEKVFAHPIGKIVDIPVSNFPTVKHSFLPDPPKSRMKFSDKASSINHEVVKQKPWTRGLVDGVIAAEFLGRQKLDQRNRIALIVLDSTLEIAFKEYLVNDSGVHYQDSQLLTVFKTRHTVHTEIQKYINLNDAIWKKIKHYSDLRNNLIHRRATSAISDDEIKDFRAVVEKVLRKLYKLKFSSSSD